MLPTYIEPIRHFVVENIREARRFLKWNFKLLPIEECSFLEINKNELNLQKLQEFLQKAISLQANVGLLSDAGVPCVADPGAAVVGKAHALGFKIKPMVGPSSLLLALMASGFNGQCFSFQGYLPIKEQEQIRRIKFLEEESARNNMTQIFIETPFRNNKLLQQLIQTLKPTTRLCVACDLTAEGEEIVSMTVKNWEKEKRDFHKRPAVFLFYYQ